MSPIGYLDNAKVTWETQMGPIESAAMKVAVAGGVSVIVLFRTRNVPREELGIVRPPLALSAVLLLVYLVWMLGSDALIHWRGPWDWRPWLAAPLAASAMRVLAGGPPWAVPPGPRVPRGGFRGG